MAGARLFFFDAAEADSALEVLLDDIVIEAAGERFRRAAEAS